MHEEQDLFDESLLFNSSCPQGRFHLVRSQTEFRSRAACTRPNASTASASITTQIPVRCMATPFQNRANCGGLLDGRLVMQMWSRCKISPMNTDAAPPPRRLSVAGSRWYPSISRQFDRCRTFAPRANWLLDVADNTLAAATDSPGSRLPSHPFTAFSPVATDASYYRHPGDAARRTAGTRRR